MIEFEKKIYSQNGEDGIIEHIFNCIGTTNKIAVEIGVSVSVTNTIENNTAFLASQNWKVYWFDSVDPPAIPENCTFTKSFITKNNICNYFENLNIPKEFDLLSIDIDSNDYYIRESLINYSPRVFIAEYNGCFDAITEHIMPYNENYQWPGTQDRNFGVSLKSLTQQANRMGYDLVYCDTNGVNAFFIQKDINKFKPLTSEEAWVKLCWS